METHGLQPTVAIISWPGGTTSLVVSSGSYRIWSLGEICVYNDTFKKGVVEIIANMSILLIGCPWSSLCMNPLSPEYIYSKCTTKYVNNVYNLLKHKLAVTQLLTRAAQAYANASI